MFHKNLSKEEMLRLVDEGIDGLKKHPQIGGAINQLKEEYKEYKDIVEKTYYKVFKEHADYAKIPNFVLLFVEKDVRKQLEKSYGRE